MNVLWLTPSAWWGLAALAVPIAIHLLTRQQARRIPFPTLRFLRPTRLAALRRRSIHDWGLLIVRLAILTAATAALAGPVFVSTNRQAQWQTRFVRAFVIAPASASAAADSMIREESGGSFASAVFRPTAHLADGLRDAAEWLAGQPPAAREVVIVGDLKEGTVAEPDLSLVPSTTGLRFLPTPAAVIADARVELPFADVVLSNDRTQLTYRDRTAADDPLLVRAAPVDTAFAEAARQAVLARGIPRDRALARRVLVLFDGANVADLQVRRPASAAWMRDALAQLPGVSGGESDDRLVVLVPMRANDVEAAHAIDRIAHVAFAEDLRALEPRVVAAATLARWSRPPAPDPSVPLSDEGDRRWLWGLALVFIALETIMRRARQVAEAPRVQEQQVA